jgi:hypothetical protein
VGDTDTGLSKPTTNAVNIVTGGNEIARFTSSGIDLKYGSLKVIDGQGIDFSATAGTGTSELFDDYEEGTWTPEINTTTPPTTPFGQYNDGATYTKIGNVVYLKGMFRTNGVTIAGAAGTLYIGGLPFAPSSSLVGGFTCVQTDSFATNTPRFGYPQPTSRISLIYTATAIGNTAQCDQTSLTTGAGLANLIQIAGFYTV